MATLSIEKKQIEKYLKLTEENIEKMTMMGAPCEISGENLVVEITPNRPDLLSVQGLVRAFNTFTGKESGLRKYQINKPEKNFKVKIDPSVKDIRPYTACAIIKNIRFDDQKIKEVIDIQEKLHTTVGRNRKKAAIGIYPLEKISLPIKFEARKPQDIKFIPLEMNEEMNATQILQRHPTGREYAKLLNGLDKYPIFTDNSGKILSMPPIINSNETGKITSSTKDVFVECSGFDFKSLNKILNIIVTALADMGGKIYAMELDYGKKEMTPNLESDKIKISIENVNKLIGTDLKEKDLEKLLPKMGYDYNKGEVIVPSWRSDVLHEVDIIEDIAIAYGYDKFIPEIPKVATIGSQSGESKVESKISEILSGLGLIEISTYHLIKDDEMEKIGDKKDKIEVENSKTEYKLLRPNLMIPAFRIFSENKDNEYPQKIFEIGTIFNRDKNASSELPINEEKRLFIGCSPANFTDLKRVLDYLMRMLKIEYELKESKSRGLIEGRTGDIIASGKRIGFIGEVEPATLYDFGIKLPVALIEISLNDLFKKLIKEQ